MARKSTIGKADPNEYNTAQKDYQLTEADGHIRTIGRLGFFPGRRADETSSLPSAVAGDDLELKLKDCCDMTDGICFVDVAVAVSDTKFRLCKGRWPAADARE